MMVETTNLAYFLNYMLNSASFPMKTRISYIYNSYRIMQIFYFIIGLASVHIERYL